MGRQWCSTGGMFYKFEVVVQFEVVVVIMMDVQ